MSAPRGARHLGRTPPRGGRATPVVMVTDAVAPDRSGRLEQYVRDLSAALVARGHDVTVVARRVRAGTAAGETGDDGVRVERRRVPSGGVREVVEVRPDAVVHCHVPVTARQLASRRRVLPYLYTFHAPERAGAPAHAGPPGRDGRHPMAGIRWPGRGDASRTQLHALQAAAVVTVLSESMRHELGLLDERLPERAHVVPGGVDTVWFSPGEPGPAIGPEVESWLGRGPVVFSARGFTRSSGVLELVEAMPAVVAAHPRVRLAVAGDGPLRAELERSVRDRGLDAHVRLLGAVGEQDLRGWFRRADLTVVPTLQQEGFGLTAARSLACGTPVAVTPVGADPELVRSLDPTLVLTGATAADLAGGLTALLGRRPALRALSARCRDKAVARWSWDAVCERLEPLYERCVARTDDAVRPVRPATSSPPPGSGR